MECPKCKGQMEEGVLGFNGQRWISGKNSTTKSINSISSFWFQGTTEDTIAWRCPKCKKVEIYTK